MGVLNKVALRFDRPFWPVDHHFIGYMSEKVGEYPQFLNVSKYTQEPVLMAFTGGNFARALESKSDAHIASEIKQVLYKIYGSSVPEPKGVAVARWSTDPFARGSYSHIPVGATGTEYDILAEPLAHGRLRFAGEATIRNYPGTVHGAFLSGVREAEHLIGGI